MSQGHRVSRRAFLSFPHGDRSVVELSCERLYMKYSDARCAGRVDALLADLARQLAAADEVRLTDRSWLQREDFSTAVGPLLERFCGRRVGGSDER